MWQRDGEMRESWSWRPRHSDGSPTCCSSPATPNSPSELMSHTSCLPFSSFPVISTIPLSTFPPPFFIPKLSVSRLPGFFTSLSGLSHLPPSSFLNLSLNFFFFSPPSCLLTTPPTLCVKIRQESHGSAILIRLEGASLFLRVTPL